MVWEGLSLESITEAHLQALVENAVPEGRTLEYKEDLPGIKHDDKREFLSDVSSFANATGGHLIYGIREDGGVPQELVGIDGIDADATKLRLENMIRDNIEPRITGIGIHVVPLESSRVAIVLRIPRSWASPHVVKFEKHWRFYSRNSAGKYPLDVDQLRTAFNLSETTYERIRNFRLDRISKIISGETAVTLLGNPKIVLHLAPLSAFDQATRFTASSLQKCRNNLLPIYTWRYNSERYNYDGYLTYFGLDDERFCSYVQFFRTGIIEAVDAILLTRNPQIPGRIFEESLIKVLPNYMRAQRDVGIEPPIIIMLSILGVKGYAIEHGLSNVASHPIDHDVLLMSDILVEEFIQDAHEAAKKLKDAFDVVWNAAGMPRSMNYDDDGNWLYSYRLNIR